MHISVWKYIINTADIFSRSQWPCGLRRRSTAARLLRIWVRIPLGTFVCCECCVLSGRGLCDGLITRLEESYRLCRVVVCDLETSKEETKSPLKGCEYKPTMGCDAEREREREREKGAQMFLSPTVVTVCLTCPTSVAAIFVARRKHGSLSRNIQEKLQTAPLSQ